MIYVAPDTASSRAGLWSTLPAFFGVGLPREAQDCMKTTLVSPCVAQKMFAGITAQRLLN